MALFTLRTAGYYYKKDEAEKLEILGFKFKEVTSDYKKGYYAIRSSRVEIKIDTIYELLAFAKEHGEVVVGFDEDQSSILIYDDYIE